ncbi:type II toxin-antitoxin system RelE/ParE family toxin [Neorhizobium galegae]|uniref:type II toxin-antitoxin system RelE/ParE family toxin n=1 Tax=Neorhizobium galegae TaxID=399 RepID=UPI00127F157E|nr:type II toxin-antitoxin system RelE/ParE family toxin [Neorhizobium galegae]KAA9388232.1 type II toxin-antitoxin system RelE/ParE family toxin [Neorhizobium galegae]KAB1109932.1 type II toxin-antitoxin system RelE/ParE family toxin [Neorhizobium galegae]MCM2501233.1 type II toxin-antitoxin system RelE/ParE family toxin [Neorhizobium galegae]MCQ1770115.1 type II toxin-antitoxin system RelE/ParE family toxin [Neorhizobium galegae]
MRLIWAEAAVADLVHLRAYIAEHNPQAASAMAARLLEIAELLIAHPEAGLQTAKPGVRRLILPQSAYSLIYRIMDQDIEIIEVFDGRRRKPRTDLAD